MYRNIITCPTPKPKRTGVAFCHRLIERRCGSGVQWEGTKISRWLRRWLWLAASTLPVIILLSAALLLPKIVWAGKAELFIRPTFVELTSRQRSATVTIVNQGDATGVFVISWMEIFMTPQGDLAIGDGVAPWSLQPHVRYSPRRVTLIPGETQLVKIALRRDKDVPDGEFYSHLKVVTLNDHERSAVDRKVAGDTPLRRTVTIETRSATAIPVIWRNSKSTPRATIESVEIDPDTSKVVVDVRRIGELSTRGYLHVVRTGTDGTRHELADPMPLVIYPTVERRVITVPLKADFCDADLGIETEVVYSHDLAGGKRNLAAYRITC